MTTLLWPMPATYDPDMKCPACGEPDVWHILLGKSQPVPTMDWHNVTEGRLRPSDIFTEEMGVMILPTVEVPKQRSLTDSQD